MNCPLCDKKLGKKHELKVDEVNMWLVCSSGDHKFKLTEMSDTTRKSITRKVLSKSIMTVKHMIDNPESSFDEKQKIHLDGQINAWQSLADYLSDTDWDDYLPSK